MIEMEIEKEKDIMIEDEKKKELEVKIKEKIMEIMEDLKKRIGMEVVLIKNDMGIVRRLEERVYVMR